MLDGRAVRIGKLLLPGVVTALFACNATNPADSGETRELTVIAGSGGTIAAPVPSIRSVPDGGSTAVSARADRGYAFARWVVSGDHASVSYVNAPDAAVMVEGGNDTVRAEFIAVPALPEHIDVAPMQTENGLNFMRYRGSWTTLPDFAALTPDTAGPADAFDVAAHQPGTGGFGVVFHGYLSIPIDGSYTFFISSSDGSVLYLNDSIVLIQDGVHTVPANDSVTLSLTQGVYLFAAHHFTATSSSPVLQVSYACPDIGIEKMLLPIEALQRCYTGPVVKITVDRPAGGETFRPGDTIHVQWTYRNPRGQTFAQMSVDNGKTFFNICNEAFPGTASSYDWQIPPGADSLITQTAVIRVKEYPPFDVRGVSNMFSIAGR